MRRRFVLAAIASIAASLPVVSSADAPEPLSILVHGNRADLISGDDALVEIRGIDADPSILQVDIDGRDITAAFVPQGDSNVIGIVDGLALGPNVVTASLPGEGAQLTITNHPIGGPVFSGEQVQPWLCTTSSQGLGQPTDAACNAPTIYTWHYMPTGGSGFAAYDPASPPSNVAMTTTDEGETVPYIVRRERGTANRGIYEISVLADPSAAWVPWDPQRGWNGKLFYPFGASCGTIHSQSSPTATLNTMALSRGFMVANSSMNVLGNNCNTITSAESVMMLRERIAERYGSIRYVIGSGCSGGSIGQQMVANAYTGMLDGIQPNCSFNDTWSTGIEVIDCHLLVRYLTQVSPHLWPPAMHSLITGHQSSSSCVAWEALFAPVADPKGGCGLSPEQEYDPTTNPNGCRGGLADYMVGVVGRRADGKAKLAYDNIGVQYGLNALRSGLILPEQFVDLNEKIGAIDIDFFPTAERRVADEGSIRTLYQSGQINDGNNMDQVATIDLRGTSNAEIHTDHHTYAMRERLLNANGSAANHVIWQSHIALVGDTAWAQAGFLGLDDWLAGAEADTDATDRVDAIARNRPATVTDGCWFAGRQITNATVCRHAFPYYGAPRVAAGGPTTNDVIKCQLKPLDAADYPVSFTAAQWTRLQTAFPSGVCDWAKPGVDQVPSIPWMTFAGGPGGVPLGDPPVSTPL